MQAKFFKIILRLPRAGRKFLAQFNKGVPIEKICGRRYYLLFNPIGSTFDIPESWTVAQIQDWAIRQETLQDYAVVFYDGAYHFLPTPAAYDFGEERIKQILQWHYSGKQKWVLCETASGIYEEGPLFKNNTRENTKKRNKHTLREGVDYMFV